MFLVFLMLVFGAYLGFEGVSGFWGQPVPMILGFFNTILAFGSDSDFLVNFTLLRQPNQLHFVVYC